MKGKAQKGITLVALILTIIVLMILAVVAISAVNDGGIIQQAQKATDKYTEAQEKEQISLAQNEWNLVKYSNTEETFSSFMESKLVDAGIATKVEGNDNGPLTVKMKSGREYTVTNSGEIVTGWYNNGDGSYTKGDTTVKVGETLTNDEVLAATGGTKSSYTGTWTILGVENGRLKLVSTTNVTSYNVKLGEEDPEVYVKDEDGNPTTTLKPEIIEIFDKAGKETSLDVEKAIWSYQHVVETLDGHARTSTGIISARSITIEDLEAEDVLNITNAKKLELSNNDYGKTYKYFYNTDKSKVSSQNKAPGSKPWSSVSTSSYDEEVFVDKAGKTVLVDSENDEVTLDYTKYSYSYAFTDTKVDSSLGTGDYWLASPCVECFNSSARFFVRFVNCGTINCANLFNSDGRESRSIKLGVRAVVYI